MNDASQRDEAMVPESPEPSTGDGLEARLRRLEAIVSALDSDALDLEQALALFEEGVGHVRRAQDILAQAELKVEELIGTEGEQRRAVDVDTDSSDA